MVNVPSKRKGTNMRLHLLPICLFLSACAGLPSAVKDVPVTKLSYTEASSDPNSYKNTSVRWGGSIIDVDNEQDYTLIQVLSYPLDFTGRPQFSKPSQGRFVIKSSEFLDPAVYAKDREITVAGVLEGDIERTVGKKTVRLPLVSSISMYLWPIYLADPYGYGYRGYGGWGYNPYYGYGYYGGPPYYGGGYYRPWYW